MINRDMFSLSGKVAVVSGGSGLLGARIALALGNAGAAVYIASRNLDRLEETVCELSEQGIAATALPLDLGDENSIRELAREVVGREGNVDILVNNANLKMMTGWGDSAELFAESLRINAAGLFMMTRVFGDEMARNGKGSIINIGSVNGMRGPNPKAYENTGVPPYLPDYYYHKAGMLNLTRVTASYYGRFGVRCNCISPSGLKNARTPAAFEKSYCDKSLLGRMATAEDIVGAVVFLASDASAFITGVNLPVDGGCTAC